MFVWDICKIAPIFEVKDFDWVHLQYYPFELEREDLTLRDFNFLLDDVSRHVSGSSLIVSKIPQQTKVWTFHLMVRSTWLMPIYHICSYFEYVIGFYVYLCGFVKIQLSFLYGFFRNILIILKYRISTICTLFWKVRPK